MQATSVTRPGIDRLSSLLVWAGIAFATLLFVLVVARLGFFSGLMGGSATAQSADLVVTARQMRFGQEEIHLRVGETVAIVLDNQDRYAHSFDIDAFDVHEVMPAKQEVYATFTATRPGVFDFYCGVGGHTQAGMVGKIIVEP